MFEMLATGIPHFDKAIDQSLAAIQRGSEVEAMEIIASALADTAVPPDREEAKRATIAEMRAEIARFKAAAQLRPMSNEEKKQEEQTQKLCVMDATRVAQIWPEPVPAPSAKKKPRAKRTKRARRNG